MLGLDGGNGADGGTHTRIVQPPARGPDRHAPGPGGPGPPGPGRPGLEHRPPAPGGRQGASAHGPHRQSHARLPSPPPHRRVRHAQLPSRRGRRPAIRNQLHRPQAHLISDPHPARHIDHSSEPVMVQPPPDTTRLEVPARVQSARLGTQGSGPGRSRSGVIAEAAVRAGARGGAGCPNLLQRPRSSRDARGESLIFRASSRRRSRSGTPLQQIRTRPRPEPPQAPRPRPSPPHHRSGQRRVRAADHHRAARQRRPRRRGRLARHSGDAPPRLDPGPDPLHPRGARGRSRRRPRRARLVSARRIVHSEQARKDVRTRGGSRPRAQSPRR